MTQNAVKFKKIENNIGLIKISRPEVLNALDRDVAKQLDSILDTIIADEHIRVVIITGDGEKSFCTGGDLRYVVNINPIEAEKYSTFMHNILNKIENMGKPVIAAINGFALGGGCQLALACDIRIASDNARIGQPEVSIGILPGWGGTQRLSRIVGPAKAKELIFTGKVITSDEAQQIGLINKTIHLSLVEEEMALGQIEEHTKSITSNYLGGKQPIKSKEKNKYRLDEEQKLKRLKSLNNKLMKECISFANEIIKNNPLAIKNSKNLINKGRDTNIDLGLQLEIYGCSICFEHEDTHRRINSFMDKNRY